MRPTRRWSHNRKKRLHQRLHHGLGTRPGLDQVQLQVDLVLGTHDRLQHAREELRAVDQQFELVAGTPWKHRPGHFSAP